MRGQRGWVAEKTEDAYLGGLMERFLLQLYAGERGDVARVRQAVTAAGLPDSVRGLRAADMLAAMRSDKKTEAGAIRFIVLEQIGRAAQRTVDDATVLATLRANGFD